MIQIPKQPNAYTLPTWDNQNNSDVNGTLWSGFNLDLSENEGKLRLGRRLLVNKNTTDISTIDGFPIGFRLQAQTGKNIWTVAGSPGGGAGKVFYQNDNYPNSSGAGFLQDANTNTPTDVDSGLSDIEIFNGELYVSRNSSSISYLPAASSTWASISSVGNGSSPTPLCAFGNHLYSVTSSGVVSINTDHSTNTSGAYTVAIPDPNQIITFIRAASNRIWIGTLNYTGAKGYIYEWDGVSTQVTKSYRLEASGALSCVIKDDVPYIIDSNGNLSAWNGGTFQKLAGFNRRNKKMLYNALGLNNTRFIHPNGMSLINGKIHMLIDGRNYDNSTASSDSIDEVIPSGIWEYDLNRGLIHKNSIATTHSGDTITDFGQAKIAGVGALTEWNVPNNASGRNGTFLCGASYYSDATTVKSGIFYDDSNDTLQKAGYLTTTKLSATDAKGFPSVQNMWQNVYTIYKQLLNSADKIVVKYRINEVDPVETTITWATTTTFTTTTDVTAYWTAGTGGEVEVLNGVGAGKCSHITSIVNNAGTYTVTVDETYTGASGTAKARFQKWNKLDVITFNNAIASGVTFSQAGMNQQSNWIQFKVWMLFTGKDEIEKLLIINSDTNPAN